MLEQLDREWQLWVREEHSLTSTQAVPLLAKPLMQLHVKDPTVFEHTVWAWEAHALELHSLTSLQVTPSPL